MFVAAAFLFAWSQPACRADSAWDAYGEYAAQLDAVAPTPMGDSHVGPVKSGEGVQLRFPVPKGKLLGYWLQVGNIVAFSGRGSSYQLLLHRDAQDGPVIYAGPVVPNGDRWNQTNTEAIDLTAAITPADQAKGTIDVWAVGKIEGDDWTIYRHKADRRITALAAVATPELEARLAAAKALADLGVAVVPMPQKIEVGTGQVRLESSPRLNVGPGAAEPDVFAAQDLAEQLAEKTGARPMVVREKPRKGDIVLRAATPEELGKPGAPGQYLLKVSPATGIEIAAVDAAGRFYGAQTLAQLVKDDPKDAHPALPALTLRDWPAFPLRAFQYDIARGQTVNVAFCKRVIRDSARLKLNGIMFYLEDDFKFDKYPFLGRPGTFTPEKARELSDYARKYHVVLIPQFEALGHAGAVLGHPELADLREAGGAWVFCTSEPKTWEFLRNVFAELAAAFPDSQYLHVGADEFEGGFGLCDRCKAKVQANGIGGLYVEHMTRLNDICRSLKRTMLFWPSHGGPTPDLSFMTLKNAAAMPHDSIPTEWIYHGPPSYPEIAQYQEAGFQDVWVCPAVVAFGMVFPDNVTSFRAIRGFYQAGAKRGVKGACVTTWEFMYGSLFENAWLGLSYSADCGWSLGSTPLSDFERRWAAACLGARSPEAPALVANTLAEPVPAAGELSRWRDYHLVSQILVTPLADTRRRFALKQPETSAAAPLLVKASDAAIERLGRLEASASRGREVTSFALASFRMMRLAGLKLVALDQAAGQYAQARKVLPQSPAQAAEAVKGVADRLRPLQPEYEWVHARLKDAVDNCGAWDADLKSIEGQQTALAELTTKLETLAADVASGKTRDLPAAQDLGLAYGAYLQVAEWKPEQCSEQGFQLRADLTGKLRAGQAATVEFEYTSGAHGLNIKRAALLVDGKEVSVDEHGGWAGGGSNGNTYRLTAPADLAATAKVELLAAVASSGGNDSTGVVWLVSGSE